jgi:hypothetical protein
MKYAMYAAAGEQDDCWEKKYLTLNINTLSLLKNKAVEILRAFFLARKRPMDGTLWIGGK